MFSPNGIRAILFDLDGTLRFNEPRFFRMLYEYSVQAGFPASEDAYRTAQRWLHQYWAQSPEMMADSQAYGEDQNGFWTNHSRLFILALGADPGQALELAPEVQRRLTEEYSPTAWVPPDVRATLDALKQAGFLLGVVSNRSHNFDAELVELGLGGYFHLALAAGEVNSWKPEAKIFLHAVEKLGIRPEQALYVGDNYYADVLGSQSAGLRPVLVDPDGVFAEATCPVIPSVALLGRVMT